MANTSTVSMTLPTDYGIEQKAIDRRRKLAEAMQAQALQPTEAGQMVGNIYVPNSPLNALSNALGAGLAARQSKKLDEEERGLAEKARTTRASEFAAALQAREGSPERFVQPDPQEFEQAADQGTEAPAGFTVPGKAGSKSAMYARLLASTDPSLQQLGMQGMMKEDDEKFGHDVKFTQDGRPYLVGDKGQVKWLDPQAVTPRDKLEFVNVGNAVEPRNPYTGATQGQSIPVQMRPGETARLNWDMFTHANPSMHQRAEEAIGWTNAGTARGQLGVAQGNLALHGANTYFNTGMAPIGVPSAGVPAGGVGGGVGGGGSPQAPYGPRNPPPMPQGLPQQGPINPGAPQLPPAYQGGAALTPKQRAELEQQRPHANQALQGVTIALDNAMKSVDDVTKAPGLSNITGPIMGRIPSIFGSSTNAQANLDTLKAQIGVQVLQAMRDASKTGGAVGNVTEKEWPILQNQLGALQQSQTTEQFKANAGIVKQTLQRMKDNARQAFESQYGPVSQPEQGWSIQKVQ